MTIAAGQIDKEIKNWSQLHAAVSQNDVKSVKELLTQGHDPYMQDELGWSPLDDAVIQKFDGIVKVILAHSDNRSFETKLESEENQRMDLENIAWLNEAIAKGDGFSSPHKEPIKPPMNPDTLDLEIYRKKGTPTKQEIKGFNLGAERNTKNTTRLATLKKTARYVAIATLPFILLVAKNYLMPQGLFFDDRANLLKEAEGLKAQEAAQKALKLIQDHCFSTSQDNRPWYDFFSSAPPSYGECMDAELPTI